MCPALRNVPVIVLSNNDGCAIARSDEAKELGIKMGEPYFKVRHFEHTHQLVSLSANFALYADMSDRMMSLAAGLGPDQEVYSIDESFIALSGVRNLTSRARTIRERILRGIGIACGIGLARTKTLAKLANHVAKDAERKPGSYPAHLASICNFAELSAVEFDEVLERTPCKDIWGIGRRISVQLAEVGIVNARQLRDLDVGVARNRWSVVVEKTVRELRGEPCIQFEDIPPTKKMITTSRSFGRPVTTLEPLIEAVSTFAQRAAEKLRKQESLACAVQVFAHSSPFRPGPRFSRSILVPLRRPSADTSVLVHAAVSGIERIFTPGPEIVKAGILLLDLVDNKLVQQELELDEPCVDKSALLTAVDALNRRFGRDTVHVGSTGASKQQTEWQMKQLRRTPRYTTCLADVPRARA